MLNRASLRSLALSAIPVFCFARASSYFDSSRRETCPRLTSPRSPQIAVQWLLTPFPTKKPVRCMLSWRQDAKFDPCCRLAPGLSSHRCTAGCPGRRINVPLERDRRAQLPFCRQQRFQLTKPNLRIHDGHCPSSCPACCQCSYRQAAF